MFSSSVRPGLVRLAGLLYLAIIVLGVWGEGAVRASLFVPDDPALTAQNLLANEGWFRLSLAADATMAVCDVALAVLLFVILRHVQSTVALLATGFRLVQSGIIGLNLLNLVVAIGLVKGDSALPLADAHALASVALDAHGIGYDLGLIFFAFNSMLTGWLLWRWARGTKVIGLLLAGAGAVYLVGSSLVILAPAWSATFEVAYLLPLVAESAVCLFLLLRARAAVAEGTLATV